MNKRTVLLSTILIFLVAKALMYGTYYLLLSTFEVLIQNPVFRLLTQKLLFTSITLGVIAILHMAKLFKLHAPRRPQLLLILLPLLVMNLVKIPVNNMPNKNVGWVVLIYVLVGFWEEFFYRGIIQTRLELLGYRVSILMGATLFGIAHYAGGIEGVLGAFIIGMTFSILRDYIGIWPLVLAHALNDIFYKLFPKNWLLWDIYRYGFHTLALIFCAIYLYKRKDFPFPKPAVICSQFEGERCEKREA